MQPPPICLCLLALIAGSAFGLPVKGGEKGTNAKSGQWTQPKDWDWSVTTGRLIPVSEAMDDLPTPSYRMLDLQQRIPAGRTLVQLVRAQQTSPDPTKPESTLASDEPTTSSSVAAEEMAVSSSEASVANAEAPSSEKTQTLETSSQTLAKESTQVPQESDSNKLQETDVPNTQENERVPVVEEPMKKVILPEICSITGIGCRDRPDKENNFEDDIISQGSAADTNNDSPAVELGNQVKVDNGENLVQTTESSLSETQHASETTKRSTDESVSNEKSTTQHNDELTSKSVVDVVQNTEKIILDSSSDSHGSSSVQTTERINAPSQPEGNNEEKEISNSDEEQEGTAKKQNEQQIDQEEISKIEDDKKLSTDTQVQLKEPASVQEQVEEAYIQNVDSFDNLAQRPLKEDTQITIDQHHESSYNAEVQKALNDDNFAGKHWSTTIKSKDSSEESSKDSSEESIKESSEESISEESSEENVQKQLNDNESSESIHSEDYLQRAIAIQPLEAQRRSDAINYSNEENHNDTTTVKNGSGSSTNETTTEEIPSHGDSHNHSTPISEEERMLLDSNHSLKVSSTTAKAEEASTESPSLGERITSYWRAATGFVSKALNI